MVDFCDAAIIHQICESGVLGVAQVLHDVCLQAPEAALASARKNEMLHPAICSRP